MSYIVWRAISWGQMTRRPATRVNINDTCNAFGMALPSTSSGLAAGVRTPPTRRCPHEYGHGIDYSKGGILDGAIVKGSGLDSDFGDRQPCMGRDFLGAGACLRLATDVILWPPLQGLMRTMWAEILRLYVGAGSAAQKELFGGGCLQDRYTADPGSGSREPFGRSRCCSSELLGGRHRRRSEHLFASPKGARGCGRFSAHSAAGELCS